MQYEEALIIGRRRRADAAVALSGYIRERAIEVCAVKPAKHASLDCREFVPVGEESLKEVIFRRGPTGDMEAHVLVVDNDGTAKACSQRTYPTQIAMQLAWSIPLPVYPGKDGQLMAHIAEEVNRKAQTIIQLPEL
jgi:hypothetical protein